MAKIFEETKEEIKEVGKKVSWIGTADGEYALSEKEFFQLQEQEYNSGYGSQEIASNLVIVFKDGSYCSRHEYDGSEHWKYNETPIKKKNVKKFMNVKGKVK